MQRCIPTKIIAAIILIKSIYTCIIIINRNLFFYNRYDRLTIDEIFSRVVLCFLNILSVLQQNMASLDVKAWLDRERADRLTSLNR